MNTQSGIFLNSKFALFNDIALYSIDFNDSGYPNSNIFKLFIY